MPDETRPTEGVDVKVGSHCGRPQFERADTSPDFVRWLRRHLEQYDAAYRRLADL
jgi:hypothetical protein